MIASICCRSWVLGLRSRSSTPRAMPRASLAAFSSDGFSRPTYTKDLFLRELPCMRAS